MELEQEPCETHTIDPKWADGPVGPLCIMKSHGDDYRNPLTTAQPAVKGRISGRHSKIGGTNDFEQQGADWMTLSSGEARSVPAGALLQVKSTAGRLQSFVFEEDGSVHGPIHAAIHVRADIKSLLKRPSTRHLKQSAAAICVLTLGMGLFLFAKRAELALWSHTALFELAVTLALGWLALCGLLLIGFKPAKRIRKSSIEISAPRKSL